MLNIISVFVLFSLFLSVTIVFTLLGPFSVFCSVFLADDADDDDDDDDYQYYFFKGIECSWTLVQREVMELHKLISYVCAVFLVLDGQNKSPANESIKTRQN